MWRFLKAPNVPLLGRGVSHGQLVISTRQLATLVKAGMPLLRSLRTVSDQLEPGALRHIFTAVAVDVEGGVKLSEALSRYPRAFPTFYVNMVRAGELGGLLDEILRRLAELMEKQQRIRDRVQSALMYPAFVMVASIAILAILMAFVVPTFLSMFTELGSALPLPTRILVTACQAIRQGWWAVALAGAGLWMLIQAALRTPLGKRQMDGLMLKLPVVGSLIHRLLIARFARTFGTLLTSGVPILGALETVRATVSNAVLDEALQEVERSLKAGESLARPLELSGAFPPLVSRMVALGEETGQLDLMLAQLADNYEEEVDIQLGGLTQLLEPLLIVGVGGIVGFIVISMFLPLLSLTKILG